VAEYDLAVRGGTVVIPDIVVEADIWIRDGKIAAISQGETSLRSSETFAARGKIVFPGVVDAHVHLREPGLTHKEDFATGTRAAAKGGVTTVGDMPNNNPPITTVERLKEKRRLVHDKSYVDYVLWAGTSVGNLTELPGLVQAGAVGFKVYMEKAVRKEAREWTGKESPHAPQLYIDDDGLLMNILKEAARINVPVNFHLGNYELSRETVLGWEGRSFASIKQELENMPSVGMETAAYKVLSYARVAGAKVHISHIPSSVVKFVAEAKAEKRSVTCETTVPLMTFDMADELGPFGFMHYKTRQEAELMWSGLLDGTIDAVATDHAPHTREEKEKGYKNILECPSGHPELETSLVTMFDEALKRNISLPQLARVMSLNPAKIIGVHDRKGSIEVGKDADLVIIDPDKEWTISESWLETKCGWSPYVGRIVKGYPLATILRGNFIMRDGEISGKAGYGQFLNPKKNGASE